MLKNTFKDHANKAIQQGIMAGSQSRQPGLAQAGLEQWQLHCPRNLAEGKDDAAGDCPRHQPGPRGRQ